MGWYGPGPPGDEGLHTDGHLQGLLCGAELGRGWVMCRPVAALRPCGANDSNTAAEADFRLDPEPVLSARC
jgi:hypothetical protein